MAKDQFTLWNFQADIYISKMEHDIKMLRDLNNPASALIAGYMEKDLEYLKNCLGLEVKEELKHAS